MTSVLAANDGIVEDWESLPSDQVQQIAQQRQALLKQQQKGAVAVEKCLNDEQTENDQGIGSMIQKPIRLLKRETPREKRTSESEKEAAKALEKLSLDERKANYDKIRERIFNSEAKPSECDKQSTSSAPQTSEVKENKGIGKEVTVEPINHLTYVQMLSDRGTMPPPNMQMPVCQMPYPPQIVDQNGQIIMPAPPPQMMMGPPPNRPMGPPPNMNGAQPSFPPPNWIPHQYDLPGPAYGCPPPPIGAPNFSVPPPNVSWGAPPPPPMQAPPRQGAPPHIPVPLRNVRPQMPKNKSNPKKQNPSNPRKPTNPQ